MSDVIQLSVFDVAGAACFVLLAGIVSVWMKLRLERDLALGVVRSVIQLSLLGYVLQWVFGNVMLSVTAAAMVAMTLAAAQAALARSGWKLQGAFGGAFLTLVISACATALVASGVLVRAEPWYQPRYALPLLGMLLGNGLTGISLCLDSLLGTFAEDREKVELELAMGATRWEAIRHPMRRSVRRGMIPIINAMMIVGLVSIPGMMTGQILAGASPVMAVRYQLLILFLIAASTSLACAGIAGYAASRMIDRDHRIRGERLTKR
ncbi:MAG: iron export ABC transporter permease subunit FetB [Myxococcota bacterium]